MKLRRIYKRDKDGQFARVNTLLGAAADAATKKRLKSKAKSINKVPSKADKPRGNRDRFEPQVLDAAAGRLSLAEGPAREIAAKHDLSGDNRSEANKAAYRECAKYARELKAKYGADAPTADRIYSAAKLIQRGGDIGAKIRQEEGDGSTPSPKPQPPKPSRLTRQEAANKELFDAQKNYDEVQKKWGNASYQRGNVADREKTAAWNRLQNAKGPFLQGKYPWPEGYQKGYGLPSDGDPQPPKRSGNRTITDADIKKAWDDLHEAMRDKSPENSKNRGEKRNIYEGLKRGKIRQDNGGVYITNQKSAIHGQGRTINIDGVQYNARVDRFKKTGSERVIVSSGSETVARVSNWEKAATAAALKHYNESYKDKAPEDLPRIVGLQRRAYLDQKSRDESFVEQFFSGVKADPKPSGGAEAPKPAAGNKFGFLSDRELTRKKSLIQDRIKAGVAKPDELDELNAINEELKRRRASKKASAGTITAGKDLKRGDVFQLPGGSGEYVVVANDGKTITAEKLGQNKLTHTRFDASRKFEKVGEGKEPRVNYGTGSGAPRSAPKPKKMYGEEVTNPTAAQVDREKLIKDRLHTWWIGVEDDFKSTHGEEEIKASDFADFFFEHLTDSHYETMGYENRYDPKVYEDRKLLEALADSDKMAARMRAGFERWLRTSKTPVDLLKDDPNYYTSDLFEFYVEGDDMDMFTYSPINMYEIKDRVLKDIREEGFDAVKVIRNRKPRKDIRDLYGEIDRSRRNIAAFGTADDTVDDRRRYQDRLLKANQELKQQIGDSTLEELKADLKKLTAAYIDTERNRKVFKNQAATFEDGDGGYLDKVKSLSERLRSINGVLRKVQTRIDEIEGKNTEEQTSFGSFKWTDDATRPSVSRRGRESKLVNAFRDWGYGQDTFYSDRIGKFKTDETTRGELIDKFFNELRSDRLGEAHGYADLSDAEKDALIAQDRKDFEESIDPTIIESRMRSDFHDWLMNSEQAYDIASRSPGRYSATDYFDLFLDGSDYNQNMFGGTRSKDLIDIPSIVKKVQNSFKEDAQFEQMANRPRPVKRPDPKDEEPVEYRAKDRSRTSELRKEQNYLSKKLLEQFRSNPDINSLPDDEKERVREKVRVIMDEISRLEDEARKIKPNRSRELTDAKDFGDLVDIMIDRNPSIHGMSGWSEPDGDLAKAMEASGVHGVHREIVLARCQRAMAAAERMADEYPDVPWDGLNAYGKRSFKNPKAIAHCSRGYNIVVEFNVNFLADQSPAPGKNADKFHPPNFESDPFYNVIIHEFGHSIDWIAFGYHAMMRTDLIKEKRAEGDNRDPNLIWNEAWSEIAKKRDREMSDLIVKTYEDEIKSGKYRRYYDDEARDFRYWKDKNTSGYAKHNTHELIAESWQDYHTNGPEKCSPVSKAVTEWVIKNYQNYVAKKGTK